ncbi:MAG: dihydrofolate reductase family protein [Rhodospirillaceae bacterium]|nr:dihydrofolate reductase family protein [Rhodospirillaceae bacterium]
MRKLILQMQMTLDGFVGKPDGDVMWAFPGFDDEYAAWGTADLAKAGLHLMGRVTYHEMAAHWPTSLEPYAAPMNDIPKLVFSRTLKEAAWPETRIARGDLTTEINARKQESGNDLLAHGGATFARSLVEAGLVDVLRLIFHPVVLGEGRRIFPVRNDIQRFRLADIRTFKTGLVAETLIPIEGDKA